MKHFQELEALARTQNIQTVKRKAEANTSIL
jgi:hypothetical protein